MILLTNQHPSISMQYNIKGTALEITPEIRDYVEKKLNAIDVFFTERDAARTDVELAFLLGEAQTFRAEFTLHATSLAEPICAEARGRALHEAIDIATGELSHSVTEMKKKREHIFRRGAAKIKAFLRGF